MEQQTLSALQVFGARVRELRQRRGMSAQKLSRRCVELGAVTMKRQIIANIELGNRSSVTVAELLMIAYALDTSPLALLMPAAGERLAVAPNVSVDGYDLAEWVAGRQWPGGMAAVFFSQSNADVRLYHAVSDAWQEYKAADRVYRWVGEKQLTGAAVEAVEEALHRYAAALDTAFDAGLRPHVGSDAVARKMLDRGLLRNADKIEFMPEEEAQQAPTA
jgi:transcriptional regulator with XRE-family HTH domain